MTLISEKYLDAQRHLHAQPRGYGGGGHKWADHVLEILGGSGPHVETLLDYGCGQNTLAGALYCLEIEMASYDPAVPPYDTIPAPADLVTCTDVLEHIEPEYLDDVIAHLHLITRWRLFVAIGLQPANKTLPDGRNAHLTIQPIGWWEERLGSHFTISKRYAHGPKTGVLLLEPKREDY